MSKVSAVLSEGPSSQKPAKRPQPQPQPQRLMTLNTEGAVVSVVLVLAVIMGLVILGVVALLR